jgi:hypothetical protein
VQELIKDVCDILSSAEYSVPYAANLRDYLVGSASPALTAPRGKRSKTDEVLIRMLGEIFDLEELRYQKALADGTATIESAELKKNASEAQVEKVVCSLGLQSETAKQYLASVTEKSVLVREARARFNAVARDILHQEEEWFTTAMRDAFLPLRESDIESPEDEKHEAVLKALLLKVEADGGLLTAAPMALKKKKMDRTDFESTVVRQLEETINAHVAGIRSSLQMCAEEASGVEDTPMTPESADALLQSGKKKKLAMERSSVLEAKRDSFSLLEKGSETNPKRQKRHVATLTKWCKKIEGGKDLLSTFPIALQKKPSERDDTDIEQIAALGDLLDKHIAALEEQLGQDGLAADAGGKQLERSLNGMRRSVESASEARDEEQGQLTSQLKHVEKVKSDQFDFLKAGTWMQQEKPRVPGLKMKSLATFLKGLDQTNAEYTEQLTAVFKKAPADRSEFDNKIIDQFGDLLESHIRALKDKIESLEAANANAMSSQHVIDELDAAQEKLEEAQGRHSDCLVAAVGAEKERQRLELTLTEKRGGVKEATDAMLQATAAGSKNKVALEGFQCARASLSFLAGNTAEEGPSPQ